MQNKEMDWHQWNEAIEDLLFFCMDPRFSKWIQEADRQYHLGSESETHGAQFENFLLYEFSADGLDFITRYKNEPGAYAHWFSAIRHHYFSGFEVMRYDNHLFLKDLFTKQDLKLLNPELIENAECVVGRVFEFSEGWVLDPDFEVYTKEAMAAFRKAILERYATEGGSEPLDRFIYKRAWMLMRYLDIVESVLEEEVLEEEDYVVHQATYVHQDLAAVRKVLEEAPECEKSLDEPEDLIYKVVTDDEIIAEVVLMKNTLVLECTDAPHLVQAKIWLTGLLGDRVVHVADEVLTLDDLLNT